MNPILFCIQLLYKQFYLHSLKDIDLTTNPTVNWLTNLPDFVPTADQTSEVVVINKDYVPPPHQVTAYLQLLLNDNTTPSYTFPIQTYGV